MTRGPPSSSASMVSVAVSSPRSSGWYTRVTSSAPLAGSAPGASVPRVNSPDVLVSVKAVSVNTASPSFDSLSPFTFRSLTRTSPKSSASGST
jgi:hypothetical protein